LGVTQGASREQAALGHSQNDGVDFRLKSEPLAIGVTVRQVDAVRLFLQIGQAHVGSDPAPGRYVYARLAHEATFGAETGSVEVDVGIAPDPPSKVFLRLQQAHGVPSARK
jgi:hypothetical protein